MNSELLEHVVGCEITVSLYLEVFLIMDKAEGVSIRATEIISL